jgi:histidinol-phosphatase
VNDLELAFALADRADAMSLPAFDERSFGVHRKDDGTVVTDVDRSIEAELRRMIEIHRPDDAVLGEEQGGVVGDRTWILDPIDGTSSFVDGRLEWSTLIALSVGDAIELGVSSAPSFGHRWWARRGEGAFRDSTRLRVSGVGSVDGARVAAWPPPRRLPESQARVAGQFQSAAAAANSVLSGVDVKPTIGMRLPAAPIAVAEGRMDAFLLLSGGPWDVAALKVLCEEAGGVVTDLSGGADVSTGSTLYSNGIIHDAVLDWLR